MFEDCTEMMREFQRRTGDVLNDSEKKSLRFDVRESERRALDEVVDIKVLGSYNGDFAPRNFPNRQGKDSDGETVFFFEDPADANDLYNFMIENHLMEPGEIVLRYIEGQSSVAFMPNVMVQKPEMIQAALMAYEELLNPADEDSIDAFESVVEQVNNALMEKGEERFSVMGASKRVTPRAGKKKQVPSGNPFHNKDGKFSGAKEILNQGGGSHVHSMDGDGWSKFTKGGDKVKKGPNAGKTKILFSATKLDCGRKGRCIDAKGNRIKDCTPTYTRCWDGNKGAGARVAKALGKKKRNESFDIADLSIILEMRALYKNIL